MLSFLGTFLLGLQLGATACAVSCMPVMTPILLANTTDKKETIEILLQYFSAKIIAYMLIAVIAFFSAAMIKSIVDNHQLFLKTAGVAIILLGLTLLYKSLKKQSSCNSTCKTTSKSGYFGIGFFSSFSFCLPLSSLIAISASSDMLLSSIFYGLFFGLGVVLVPFLLFYFFIYKITSTFLTEFLQHKKIIEIASQLFLIFIGISVINGWIKL